MPRRRTDSAHTPATSKVYEISKDTLNTQTSKAGTWFLQFPPFVYDPTADLRSNFERLATSRNWGEKLKRKRWAACQIEEFGNAYGTNTTRLESWQNLCREVHIPDPPDSINKCRNVLGGKNVWVNLVNLIDHRNIGVEVIRFRNRAEFLNYTKPDRVFPKKAAKEEGFIKALLRRL